MTSVIEEYVKTQDKEAPASKNSNLEDDDIEAKRESPLLFSRQLEIPRNSSLWI